MASGKRHCILVVPAAIASFAAIPVASFVAIFIFIFIPLLQPFIPGIGVQAIRADAPAHCGHRRRRKYDGARQRTCELNCAKPIAGLFIHVSHAR
ncbi:MAG: hypothetical protein AB7P35_10920 [Hyphomonadaceae bacterium]